MLKAGILPGDLVIVRRQETAVNGEIVIALIGDEATCKRYSRKNGHVWLLPENDDYSAHRRHLCPHPRQGGRTSAALLIGGGYGSE